MQTSPARDCVRSKTRELSVGKKTYPATRTIKKLAIVSWRPNERTMTASAILTPLVPDTKSTTTIPNMNSSSSVVTGTIFGESKDSNVGAKQQFLLSEQQAQQRRRRQVVLNSYLEPLLTKHRSHQEITFEDLMASKNAADQALQGGGGATTMMDSGINASGNSTVVSS